MAKSSARKFREKLVREGKMDPLVSRSPFAYTDMRTRKTKSKKDYLFKSHNFHDGKDDSFYFDFMHFYLS